MVRDILLKLLAGGNIIGISGSSDIEKRNGRTFIVLHNLSAGLRQSGMPVLQIVDDTFFLVLREFKRFFLSIDFAVLKQLLIPAVSVSVILKARDRFLLFHRSLMSL